MFGPERLARRLLAGLAAGLGLASLAFLALFTEIYQLRLGLERANASEQVSRLLQVSLENAMLKRDLPGLEQIVDRLGRQPGITGVMILNPQRQVRFASDRKALQATLAAGDLGCRGCQDAELAHLEANTQLVANAGTSPTLRSVTPIKNRAECGECHGPTESNPLNGILVVDHDAAGIRAEALRAAAAMSGAGILVVLLGLGSVWMVLRRQVLAPVAALDGASRRLAAGDLATRVAAEPDRNDELGDLCRSFNGMAEKLESGVAAIRAQETFLQKVIDTVPDGVRVIDETYTVVMANGSYARQSRAEPSALIGVPCYHAHGRTERCPPTLVTCPFHALQSDGEPIRYIHRHVRSDGSEVHVETTAARVTLEHGERPRFLVIEAIRDLEQQVKYSHEQRLAEIGQLAAGVAHEIYNPLASVRLGLQAVLKRSRDGGGLDADTSAYLAMVDGEVDKCISVTRRLLDLSQTPSQSVQLVSFSTIIPEVISLLRFEAESTGVELSLDLGRDDLRVFATDAELRMLALNLAQNAFHAMPGGGRLTVTGRLRGGEVVVSFADTGVGIAPDVLAHIFDPFYSKRADGVPGTGLGLTICKAIAARYQGRIEVESTPGNGATFSLVFPVAEAGKTAP